MKDETIEKVNAEIADWQYLKELPEKWHDFRLDRNTKISKDSYDLYRYVNEELHKSATIYFHEETHEYKVRLKIGLIEFCRIEFITANIEVFEKLLKNQFEQVLMDMVEFNPKSLSSIVLDKKITTWETGNKLPETVKGFHLFISPAQPVKINNGSYIVIDYVDFSLESSFTVYYNIYRDEFFAEARIWNIPDVNYDFDSNELSELEAKMHQHFIPRLIDIRTRAEKEAAARAATEAKQAEDEQPV